MSEYDGNLHSTQAKAQVMAYIQQKHLDNQSKTSFGSQKGILLANKAGIQHT